MPSFTRNRLAKRRGTSPPASFSLIDKAALASTVVALPAWFVTPELRPGALLLCLAGVLLAVLLARGYLAAREPILLILHIGWWLALAVFMFGGSVLYEGILSVHPSHGLTTRAIGTMTVAVMTWASLGHTGRAITADGWVVAAYAFVNAGLRFGWRLRWPANGIHTCSPLGVHFGVPPSSCSPRYARPCGATCQGLNGHPRRASQLFSSPMKFRPPLDAAI